MESENGSEFGIEYTEEQFKEWMQDGTIHVSVFRQRFYRRALLILLFSETRWFWWLHIDDVDIFNIVPNDDFGSLEVDYWPSLLRRIQPRLFL